MITKVVSLMQKSLSIVLFFVFVIFIFISIWFNSSQGSKNAQELLTFTKNSVEQIDKSLIELATKSSGVEFSEASFDLVTGYLDTLSQRLQSYSYSIPNKNIDTESTNLETTLKTFYTNLKTETVDKFLAKTTAQKSIIEDYNSYAKLKSRIATGFVEDIRNSAASGIRVLELEQKYLDLTTNPKLLTSNQKSNTEDQDKLNQLTDLLKSYSDDTKLTSADQAQATKIFNNYWALEIPDFHKISIEDLKTKKFNDNISTLQNNINSVASRYGIN